MAKMIDPNKINPIEELTNVVEKYKTLLADAKKQLKKEIDKTKSKNTNTNKANQENEKNEETE